MDWSLFFETIILTTSTILLFLSVFVFFWGVIVCPLYAEKEQWSRLFWHLFSMVFSIISGSFFWTILWSIRF